MDQDLELDLDLNGEDDFSWSEFVEQHRWSIFIGLIGLTLVGLGAKFLATPNEPNSIQIIPSDNKEISVHNTGNIVIDIAGAINKPGIFELPYGSRVQDAIVAAGGLSDQADVIWVEQQLNRAAKLTDGQKLYILNLTEAKDDAFRPPQGTNIESSSISSVSINSANQSQLESLWGIGPVTAESIISGRPYSSLQELLDNNILKQNVWDRNKDKLSL